MNVASRSAVEECVGVIKTRLANRRGDSGGHGVSECRSDVSESPGIKGRKTFFYMVTWFVQIHLIFMSTRFMHYKRKNLNYEK